MDDYHQHYCYYYAKLILDKVRNIVEKLSTTNVNIHEAY